MQREKSRIPFRWNAPNKRLRIRGMHLSRDRLTLSFNVLDSILRTLRKLFAQLVKQFLRQRVLLLAASCEPQHDLSERFQVAPALHALTHLIHAQFFVSVKSPEPQHCPEPRIEA